MGRSQAHLQSIAGIPPALLDQQLCSSQICSTIGASVHAFVLTGLLAAATTGTARQSEKGRTHNSVFVCLRKPLNTRGLCFYGRSLHCIVRKWS